LAQALVQAFVASARLTSNSEVELHGISIVS